MINQKGAAMSNTDQEIRGRLEILHNDITLANTYRLETTKLLLAITTALFAFTISFRPSLKTIENESLMLVGWIALAASLVGGIFELFGWERFYISYREDYHEWRRTGANESAEAKAARSKITFWRRL